MKNILKDLFKQGKTQGFTLIELLVVVAIIGVLTAVLLVNLVGIRERAADTRLKSDLRQLKTALRIYYNDNQSYPADSNGNTAFNGCGSGGNSACAVGDTFQNAGGTTTYMGTVPEYSFYDQINNGDGFILGVIINNSSDADANNSATECGVSSPVANTFYVCAD